jgi:hypothetical protein
MGMLLRRASLVLFVLLSGGSVMAQITTPVTFNVFGRANRQPGTYISASAQVPLGVYALGLTDTMTDADAADVANAFRLTVRVSQDGVDWSGPLSRVLFTQEWTGGTHFDKRTQHDEPNHFAMSWSNNALANGDYVGWFVRAEIDQPVQMRVGFDCVVYPSGFQP